jgi:predicted phage terminase large subunit-like protein
MIKRVWIRRYDVLPDVGSYRRIIQSWDTASKEGAQNDYSVCTTWLLHESRFYLIDVLRGRFNYPTLKEHVIAHAQVHTATQILIEDTGVGIALVQELSRSSLLWVTPIKAERDKLTRMSVQSGKFASGQVWFPNRAPWLAELETELFTFPQARHDDQVDSISQALANGNGGYDVTMRGV